MGHVFTVPSPVPTPKPKLALRPSAHAWHTLAGVELAMGRARAAERLADIAEEMRSKLSVAEVAQ